MTSKNGSRFRWQLWVYWTVATTLGWRLSIFAVVPTFADLALPLGWFFVYLTATGTPIGLFQWLVLKRRVTGAGWWICVAAITWALYVSVLLILAPSVLDAFVYVYGLPSFPSGEINTAILAVSWVPVALVALLTGIVQWFFFLRRRVRHAGWWVPGSFIGYAAVYACLLGLLATLMDQQPWFRWLAWYGLGFVHGSLTGLLMAWLLRDSSGGAESGAGL